MLLFFVFSFIACLKLGLEGLTKSQMPFVNVATICLALPKAETLVSNGGNFTFSLSEAFIYLCLHLYSVLAPPGTKVMMHDKADK
jgi:hypothetical protein